MKVQLKETWQTVEITVTGKDYECELDVTVEYNRETGKICISESCQEGFNLEHHDLSEIIAREKALKEAIKYLKSIIK